MEGTKPSARKIYTRKKMVKNGRKGEGTKPSARKRIRSTKGKCSISNANPKMKQFILYTVKEH